MNTRHFIAFVLGVAALAAVATAQVVVRGTESSDNSAVRSEVNITTMDRSITPLIKDTRQAKPDANTVVTETVTRDRLNDGSYFDAQRSTTVKKQLSPDVAEVSTAVVEKDRQGNDRTTSRTIQTVAKNGQGEKSETKVYSRNSSGQLVLDRVIDANTVTNASGRANTTRVERVADVSGNIIVDKQIEEATGENGPKEKVTTAVTRSVDHRTGRIDVTEQATTTVRTDTGAKEIDTVIRIPGRTGWEMSGRKTTTEKTAPDGSVSREIVEQGRSLYSERTGDQLMEPLVPQRRTLEQETRAPNGTVVVQREVFHRDVNGDWKPDSFSTHSPDVGPRPSAEEQDQRTAPPPPEAPKAAVPR